MRAALRPAYQAAHVRVTHFLANPPLRTESWIDWRPDAEWQPFLGTARRPAFRWLLHCLQRLSSGDKLPIIMPAAAAFSASSRERVRRQLADRSMVEAVIALPSRPYTGTNITTTIWIVVPESDSDQPILLIEEPRLALPGDAGWCSTAGESVAAYTSLRPFRVGGGNAERQGRFLAGPVDPFGAYDVSRCQALELRPPAGSGPVATAGAR